MAPGYVPCASSSVTLSWTLSIIRIALMTQLSPRPSTITIQATITSSKLLTTSLHGPTATSPRPPDISYHVIRFVNPTPHTWRLHPQSGPLHQTAWRYTHDKLTCDPHVTSGATSCRVCMLRRMKSVNVPALEPAPTFLKFILPKLMCASPSFTATQISQHHPRHLLDHL